MSMSVLSILRGIGKMPKETITMTRDLFDEMLEAVRVKEQQRLIELLKRIVAEGFDGSE